MDSVLIRNPKNAKVSDPFVIGSISTNCVLSISLSLADINECVEELHVCTPETQTCLNSRGGYTCQDKPSTKCMTGFLLNPETRRCEGNKISVLYN